MQEAQYRTFITDLQSQLELFEQMEELNGQQETLLAQGRDIDPDQLVAFVGQKQNLMSAIEAAKQKLEPQRQQWASTREDLPSSARDLAQMLLDRTSQTIGRLLEMEDQAQRSLEVLMQNASGALQNIRQKSRINQAYTAYGAPKQAPRYVDRQIRD